MATITITPKKTNKKGQFANIEEAVKFKNAELVKAFKGIDINVLSSK